MIPRTSNGLDRMACLSAMQKCIRRGLEREALGFALEIANTDKGGFTMVCNRLELISHEDVGCPFVIVLVATAVEQARRFKAAGKDADAPLFLATAIKEMCRVDKTRENCNFVLVGEFEKDYEGYVPEIPDFAYDIHTSKGRQMGRGVDQFLEEGAIVIPESPDIDQWKERGEELLKLYYKKPNPKSAPNTPTFWNED